MAVNGMTVAAPFNGGGVSTYILDSVNVDEVSVAVSGGLGESDIGGPVMNLVPRSGGNSVPRSGVHQQRGRLVKGRQPERRAARGRHHGDARHHQLLRRERARTAARSSATDCGSLAAIAGSKRRSPVQGVVANANAFDAARWDWVADPSVTARQLQGRAMYIGRFTAQVSAKHRISFNHEYQRRCEGSPLKIGSDGCQHARAPTGSRQERRPCRPRPIPTISRPPYYLTQAIWTAPMTNKLLLEAGFTPILVQGRHDGQGPAGRDLRSDHGDRAVHGDQSGDGPPVRAAGELRLSGGPDDQPQLRQPEQLARLGVVRHRVARHEGRLPGRATSGSNWWFAAYPTRSCPTGSTRACRISSRSGCRSGMQADRTSTSALYRAGQVDARPVDAAGRAALRPRLELQPGGAQRNGR